MADVCASNSASRFSLQCEEIREYHIVVFSLFGVLTACYTPIVVVINGYLWRTRREYYKQKVADIQKRYSEALQGAASPKTIPTTVGGVGSM